VVRRVERHADDRGDTVQHGQALLVVELDDLKDNSTTQAHTHTHTHKEKELNEHFSGGGDTNASSSPPVHLCIFFYASGFA